MVICIISNDIKRIKKKLISFVVICAHLKNRQFDIKRSSARSTAFSAAYRCDVSCWTGKPGSVLLYACLYWNFVLANIVGLDMHHSLDYLWWIHTENHHRSIIDRLESDVVRGFAAKRGKTHWECTRPGGSIIACCRNKTPTDHARTRAVSWNVAQGMCIKLFIIHPRAFTAASTLVV